MINKILFTGDIARPLSQKGNIEFFYYLLRRILFEVTNIRSELLSEPMEHLTLADWQKTQCDGPYADKDAIETFDLSDSLVIGFEMSLRQSSYLKANDIPFVNFQIAPIRFLSDLAFSIDTSFEIDEACLVTDDEICSAVDYVRACCSKKKPIDVPSNSLLAIGQWTRDRSLIKADGSGFHKISDFKNQIDKHSNGFNLLYKEHPYWPSFYTFCDLYSQAINASEMNIYQLLCNSNVKSVIGISSSVLSEATYFEKTVVRLIPAADTGFMVSGADFLSYEFWCHLLLGDLFYRHAKGERNFVRKSIGCSWGYDFC